MYTIELKTLSIVRELISLYILHKVFVISVKTLSNFYLLQKQDGYVLELLSMFTGKITNFFLD